MYPIHQFIYRSLGTSCKHAARKRLAEKLGNNSKTKAFNLAEKLLTNPAISEAHALRLQQALGVPLAEIRAVLRDTYQQLDDEYRKRYFEWTGPHLQVITEGPVSSPFFASLLHGQVKVIRLPHEILFESLGLQLSYVKKVVGDYRSERGDQLLVFGRVLGFNYCPDSETVYEISLSGELIQKGDYRPSTPGGGFTISGKSFGLMDIPGFMRPG